jgi:cystathionine beta-lyase/cystathionine gamma-synthase
MNKSTRIIHSIPVDELTGSISVPIYQTATYVQEAPGVNKGYDYARTNNPTRAALEKIIAELEGGTHGFAFATGLAAIDAILKTLKYGDEIVAVDDIYGGAYRLFTHIYQKFGIGIHYVDTTDASNVAAYLNKNTKLVWLESPTNPTLKISDIKTIAELAHKVGALVVIDNTFATPIAQNPLELGADYVMHSGTKYLGGHSDLLAGLVVVKDEKLAEELKFIQNSSGGILGPQDCFLVIRGIETVAIRVERQCESAVKIADFLASHPDVDHVNYPGLKSHKNHEIAKVQQNGLYGGMISFSLKNDTEEASLAFVTSTKYFKLAESLGGVKSLLCHPSQMTHKSVPREKRLASGINDSLIRLSVGIEGADDLIGDLDQAFAKAKGLK